MEAIYRKARSLIAKAYPRVHFSLDERNFAARRFFEELWSYGSISFGAPRGLFLPQELILFPRSLYGSSVHCCSTGFCAKTHWGLNKTVGIFAVPSMHHARSARLPYALYDDKEPFKRSNPTRGFDEKTVSLVTRFRRVWRALVAIIPTLDSRSSSRLVYFFLQLFLLNKKKLIVPLSKGKEQNPVGIQRNKLTVFQKAQTFYEKSSRFSVFRIYCI